MVPLYDAFEPAAFGQTDGVHIIPGREQRRTNQFSRLNLFGKLTELLDTLNGHPVKFLDVPQQGLGDALLFLIVKTQLDGVIAVALLGLALEHAVGSSQNDRYRRNDTLRAVNAGLAQFFS